jgi:GntR family transcriptional repressor for pyruvate dehydrogenase complex
MPQSGTFIADLGLTAINGMIDQIINLPTPDFKSLVETRIFLELKLVKFAAARHTHEDLIEIEEVLEKYKFKVLTGEDAVAEDLLFHLSIAKASHNPTLNRLMLTITPQIITDFEKYHVCKSNTALNAIDEHQAIVDAIRAKDPSRAEEKMKEHFRILYQYCYEKN